MNPAWGTVVIALMIAKVVCGVVAGLAILAMANPCFCAPAREEAAHEGCPGHEAPASDDPSPTPEECCCALDHLYAESRFSDLTSGSAAIVTNDVAIVGNRPQATRRAIKGIVSPFADKVPLWLEIRCLRR